MLKRILTILITLLTLLSAVSCSVIGGIDGDLSDCELTSFSNEDYHFKLTYPALFESVTEELSEENDDETLFRFKTADAKYEMTLQITYKQTEDLYAFIEEGKLEKNKVIPLSNNSFIYDKRSTIFESSHYYIYGATRRMLYCLTFSFASSDDAAYAACDRIGFEFTEYANITKDSYLLSPKHSLLSYIGVRLMPNLEYEYFPLDMYGNPGLARQLTAKGNNVYARFSVPTARYTLTQLTGGEYLSTASELIKLLGGDHITEVVAFTDDAFVTIPTGEIMTCYTVPFSCVYNGGTASGTLAVGYGAYGQYFEYITLITDRATDGELDCYIDMLATITSKP